MKASERPISVASIDTETAIELYESSNEPRFASAQYAMPSGVRTNTGPAQFAIAMSASTIIVAANAQLLRRLRLRPDADGPAPMAHPAPAA